MPRYFSKKSASGGLLAIYKLGRRYQKKLNTLLGVDGLYYTNAIDGKWLAFLGGSDEEGINLLRHLYNDSHLTKDGQEYVSKSTDDYIERLTAIYRAGKMISIPWTKAEMYLYDEKSPTTMGVTTESSPAKEELPPDPSIVESEKVTFDDLIEDDDELERLLKEFDVEDDIPLEETKVEIPPEKDKEKEKEELMSQMTSTYKDFLKFFSETSFKPSIRMIDTLSRLNLKSGQNYIKWFMELINHPDREVIVPKLKSDEWKNIHSQMLDIYKKVGESIDPINTRLEIVYGPNGTGKTYDVIKEYQEKYPDIGVMACSSSMSSAEDLLQVFDFDEGGKPVFKDSPLTEAIKKDQPVILEEARLMQQSAMAFLQSLLDCKDYVDTCRGRLYIGPNFKVIMTMNLEVNGVVYELPEPIVDRAQVILKKEMDASLAASILVNRMKG